MNVFFILCLLYLFLDIYMYFGLKSLFTTKKYLRIFQVVYLLSSVYVYYSFYVVHEAMTSGRFFSNTSSSWALGIVFTAVFTKLVFVAFMFLQDGGRVLWGLGDFIRRLITGQSLPENGTFFPSRRKFLTLGATGIAAIPFFSMLYGITKGKYRYTVSNVKLAFDDLPKAFEGFKIVQISDIHAGSLDDKQAVARGVRMINAQNPDLIVFTGDLVNSDKDEVNPFIDIFKELSAQYGKFSVLGNHDYYGVPDGVQAKSDYWADFYKKYKAMGFQLLNNESHFIEKDNERISLLGVENWGNGSYFPKKGDLDKTLSKVNQDDFCILMSHDPSHWDEKVLPHPRHINLTLSGHTHGMQFGINLPGLKWSPVQYRYKRWMGLYEEAKQYLYVNRGFGFLAFPGRVGMWPEITVIELSQFKS